ncbi:MAG: ABC transporter permease [Caldilineaceae bacterium SB0661_bin_32]|uniref:ABC transporter permease n=1 Tax=Caldilineaceae bacterium SB0661_bin_32 TaxID=2605255 RepID=A0A6B1D8X5_9CHLR|nr:ABC transporter permease [Caldilineaceae bacterium SB0661_bin_32]
MSSFLNSVALYLAVALGLILAGAALISLRNPIIGKLGIRNIPRRPTQSALIVFGLTLSTMIIVSALSLGDTLDNTVRRQTIDAYGQIDQVVSPPFLMDLTQLADGGTIDPDGASSPESAALLNALTGGDINALIAILDEGLPGITEERKAQLQEDAASYPLIDGVAGSILFPTIIRNVNTGQGEPLGFIFAVDEGYDTGFGLHDIDGEPVRTADLRDGIGDVFVDLVGLWEQSGETAEAIGTAMGLEETGLVGTALALGAAGAVLLQEEGPSFTLRQLALPVEVLRNLGFPSEILDEIDSDVISLEGLGITDEELAELNLDPDAPITVPTLPMLGFDVPNQQELIIAATEALSSINLNTLGQDVDERLGQFGLQLRQGEVYLNELGALQLDARAGDLLEIFIGPIPVPYRVRAVVAEAGPLGAVLPVVMMHTDEAQKLLFMPGKVNNILISNAGDEVSGMVHTAEVSDQLRALSLNEERLAGLLEVLRRPGIAEVIRKESAAPVNPLFDDDVPDFIMQIAGMWTQATSFESDLEILVDYVTGPPEGDIPIALRGALSSGAVQDWLRSLPLGNDDRRALDASMANLRDFDVLSPLSKQFVTDIAEIGGIALGTVFSSFGILSIFAGVLLIFLIFVMLAAERRSELGIARAVGMRRVHLVQMFVTEGLVYDLAAALVGLGLGLLVSYGMIGFMSGLLNNIVQRVEGASAPIRFYWHAAPSSLIVAYCLGVILTFVVVTVASWNVSRLNIISAIRNLPDTSNGKRLGVTGVSLRGLALIFLLGAGGYLTWLGRDYGQTVAFIGATLLLVGVGWGGAWLGRRWRSGQAALRLRLAYTFVGVGLLTLWGVPWSSVLDADLPWFNQNPGFTLLSFALSGPFIIIGAIMVVMFNADSLAGLFVRLVGGIGPLTPVLKTAVAYPLSNRFRTGTAMLLFAMVITTVTVMSVVIRATEVVTEPDEQRTAGFDIVMSPSLLSLFDPVTDIHEEAERRADFPSDRLAVLGTVARMGVTAEQLEPAGSGIDSSLTVYMAGIDEGYAKQAALHYGFQMRAEGFGSDEAIWQALAERDDVAVVTSRWVEEPPAEDGDAPGDRTGRGGRSNGPPWRRGMALQGFYLEEGGTLPHVVVELSNRPDRLTTGAGFELGGVQAEVTTSSPTGVEDGEVVTHKVQVIGVLAEDDTLAEASFQMNRRILDILNGEPVKPDVFYAKVVEGESVGETAQALEKSMLSSGLNAAPLSELFAAGQAILRGILGLFQGFLALGLVVGIAGLGVISSRTVVERRQQIGVLRAIGYPSGTVALLFVLEANFIALTGILVGGITGLILGDKTIGQAYDLATQLSFPTPWLTIAGMLAAAWLFSLLTTILPAWQASRIYPAEALRYE